MSEMVQTLQLIVSFFFFKPEKKWLQQNLLRGHKYELIFAAL